MGFHKQNWMEQATNVKPIFYKSYVDDIFGVFESESDAAVFYSYLNNDIKILNLLLKKRKIANFPF